MTKTTIREMAFAGVVWSILLIMLSWFLTTTGSRAVFAQIATPTSCPLDSGCVRPNVCAFLAPTPTAILPLAGTQPVISTIATTMAQEATSRNWADWVLKTVGRVESDWTQFDDHGCTLIGRHSCDYGIMQINWVHYDDSYDGMMIFPNVACDHAHNVTMGAAILNSKLNQSTSPRVNDGDLSPTGAAINWYLKLWAYNGFSSNNNPANDSFDPARRWITTGEQVYAFPYQETILYTARYSSCIQNECWSSIGEFPLPDDALFAAELAPSHDLLIFPITTTSSCGGSVDFHFMLATTAAVTTTISITNADGATVRTLVNTRQWDGQDTGGTQVPDGNYDYTIAVRNITGTRVGLQSSALTIEYVDCQIYLPMILKGWPPLPRPPTLYPIDNADSDGHYSVIWSVAERAENYLLEEDDNAAFSSPVGVFFGADTTTNITGRIPGTYYYRVKGRNSCGDGPWSVPQAVTVLPPTPTPTDTPVPTPTATPWPAGIYGMVTYHGMPVSGIGVGLARWEGDVWNYFREVVADDQGRYAFRDQPGWTGQDYAVFFLNERQATPTNLYLEQWRGPVVSAYTMGTTISGGNGELRNIQLLALVAGATESFPVTFQWQTRNIASEQYKCCLYDETDTSFGLCTSSLAAGTATVGQHDDIELGHQYVWTIQVEGNEGSVGWAYEARPIIFTGSSLTGDATETVAEVIPLKEEPFSEVIIKWE